MYVCVHVVVFHYDLHSAERIMGRRAHPHHSPQFLREMAILDLPHARAIEKSGTTIFIHPKIGREITWII